MADTIAGSPDQPPIVWTKDKETNRLLGVFEFYKKQWKLAQNKAQRDGVISDIRQLATTAENQGLIDLYRQFAQQADEWMVEVPPAGHLQTVDAPSQPSAESMQTLHDIIRSLPSKKRRAETPLASPPAANHDANPKAQGLVVPATATDKPVEEATTAKEKIPSQPPRITAWKYSGYLTSGFGNYETDGQLHPETKQTGIKLAEYSGASNFSNLCLSLRTEGDDLVIFVKRTAPPGDDVRELVDTFAVRIANGRTLSPEAQNSLCNRLRSDVMSLLYRQPHRQRYDNLSADVGNALHKIEQEVLATADNRTQKEDVDLTTIQQALEKQHLFNQTTSLWQLVQQLAANPLARDIVLKVTNLDQDPRQQGTTNQAAEVAAMLMHALGPLHDQVQFVYGNSGYGTSRWNIQTNKDQQRKPKIIINIGMDPMNVALINGQAPGKDTKYYLVNWQQPGN